MWYPIGGSEQLFDLVTDPCERHNLAGASGHAEQQQRLRQELIRRHQARGSLAVENGHLVEFPIPDETEADRRNTSWPGYHTEFYTTDVRH
jgi:hypothetical protein